MAAARAEKAPAKVNLTLRVVGRRADGYHDIESLVAFAGVGDALTFAPGGALALAVSGPTAAAAGDVADNLVLKAARALAERVEGLKLGRFTLSKRLRSPPDWAAARRMRRRPCGCWRARTASRPTIPASRRRRARPAPTCRCVLIRVRV